MEELEIIVPGINVYRETSRCLLGRLTNFLSMKKIGRSCQASRVVAASRNRSYYTYTLENPKSGQKLFWKLSHLTF